MIKRPRGKELVQCCLGTGDQGKEGRVDESAPFYLGFLVYLACRGLYHLKIGGLISSEAERMMLTNLF